MPEAVASDWVVDAPSDLKRSRHSPLVRYARIRLQSGAGTLPTGANPTVPLPPNGRLGLRNNPMFVKVSHGISTPTGLSSANHWQYDPTDLGLKTFRRNVTASLVTDMALIRSTASQFIAGTVLYIEVTGR